MGIAKKISDRLKQCDRIQDENRQLIRALNSEAKRKTDYLSEKIIKTGKRLASDTQNKKLREEYASQIVARQMFSAGSNLNDALTELEDLDAKE